MANAIDHQLIEITHRDVNKLIRVLWLDNLFEGNLSKRHVSQIGTRAGCDDDVALSGPLDGMEYDVLLKNIVIFECLASRIKHMQTAQGHFAQKESSERPEIGAVAEASGDDGDQLTSLNQQLDCCGHEGAVEVCGLDPDSSQPHPVF